LSQSTSQIDINNNKEGGEEKVEIKQKIEINNLVNPFKQNERVTLNKFTSKNESSNDLDDRLNDEYIIKQSGSYINNYSRKIYPF
jgi:selenocysteine lyase/cysteine desulfurase